MKYTDDFFENLLSQMTLEEKAGLCSGADFWHTKNVNRLGIPNIMVSDGPHGLRKQKAHTNPLGLGENIDSVCYPTGSALASSFDRQLIFEVGSALAEEALSEGIHTLLGPAINIKRSPLCGRNFEYFSEDPYLTSEMAIAYIKGVQKNGVGTCIKHFAVNNCENDRMVLNALLDERSLREIYLYAFEKAVKNAAPWSIMASYNRVNGTYASENPYLLTHLLREEWGFDGVVISDWGAVNDRCAALSAGLDLEMPSSRGENDRRIIDAVDKGDLSEEVLDKTVLRLLRWIFRSAQTENPSAYCRETHHQLAKKAALSSAVLLKNNGLLPLDPTQKIAFIGEFAARPRIQGGGSSHVKPYKIISALEAAIDMSNVSYAKGFYADSCITDEALIQEAIELAKISQTAVVFLGLRDAEESEGYDRNHLFLSADQTRLLEEVCAVQPNTVVVLQAGSPVAMPWIDTVCAVLLMHLAGQGGGQATADLLFGKANPSGKLAETYPLRREDTPTFIDALTKDKNLVYGEGLYVGYRYYDQKRLPVLFPFGYGLSYTTFSIQGKNQENYPGEDNSAPILFRPLTMTDEITIDLQIKNTGLIAGSEVIQLYIAPPLQSKIPRPPKELKGFHKLFLQPGEERTLRFTLSAEDFSYYEPAIQDKFVLGGDYEVLIGNSSRDIFVRKVVSLSGWQEIPFLADFLTTVGDVLFYSSHEEVKKLLMKKIFPHQKLSELRTDSMASAFALGLPLGRLISFYEFTSEEINDIFKALESNHRDD